MSESTEKSFKHSFTWIVEGVTLEKLTEKGFQLLSKPIFIDIGGKMTQWKGSLESADEGYLRASVSVPMECRNDNTSFKLSIAINDHRLVGTKRRASDVECTHTTWGWSKFISCHDLFDDSLGYLEDGIRMKMVYDLEVFYKENVMRIDDMATSFLKRSAAYYSDTSFTDFVLKSSDGEEFKVHRLVLGFASDFFMKMFTTDMEEKQKGYVQFEDIDSGALKEVISYIYKGEADIDDVEKATKVIDVAEKFNLPGLKEMCVKKLEHAINEDNVVEILSIADMYNEKKLEKLCLEIIVGNYAAVKGSLAWNSISYRLLLKITDAMDTSQTIFKSSI